MGDSLDAAEPSAPSAPKDGYTAGSDAPSAPSSASAKAAFQKPTKEVLLTFLANGVKVMTSDETRQLLRDPSIQRPGLKLIELQRSEWDTLGVDRDFGCLCLDKVEQDFPGDQELLDARQNFVHTAERTFLKSLIDRAPETESLERKRPMPREIITQFFEACNTQMHLPEFKEKLVRHVQDKKTVPNEIVVNMQRDMLEIFGFEREHGCRQLSAIGKNFPGDQELFQFFGVWQRTAQQTCMSLVQAHMQCNGDFVGNCFGDNPHMEKLKERATEELGTMTPQERGALLQKMEKKIQVFSQLPPEARERQMKRLGEDEQVEFVKAQLLLVSVMKQQWKQQQAAGRCPNHPAAAEDEPGESQETKAALEEPLLGIDTPAPAPPQQQMM